jgi:restriction endonuclease S subunit
MLEGLEISEINMSHVLQDNENKRIDSEYFRKQFLNFFNNVPNLRPLGYFAKYGYRVVYENTQIINKQLAHENNYPYFLQATDLKTPFIDISNLFYVHEEDWERYPKGRIVKGEILIEVKGKIDKVAIVPDNFPAKTLVTGSLFKLTVNDKISKHVLLTYLVSKYGIAFKDRYKTNLLISFVSKPDLYRIPVPSFSTNIQSKIDLIFQGIFSSNNKSQDLYSKAESILLETLGLTNFKPSTEGVNLKSFKESFLATGRLDAEYYQKKFDILEKAIRSQKHKAIKDFRTDNFRGMQPIYVEDGDLDIINSKHILEDSLDYNGFEKTSSDYWDTQKRARVFKGDILTYTTGANIGRTQVFQSDKKALASNHVNIIRIKEHNPTYIGFVLNSLVGRMQTDKFSAGSAQAELYPKDLDEFLIPIIEDAQQEKIASLIDESFRLKKQSEQLLETAKRAVEIAIEQDEEAAMRFIQNAGV